MASRAINARHDNQRGTAEQWIKEGKAATLVGASWDGKVRAMRGELKTGDRVSWNSEAGRVKGVSAAEDTQPCAGPGGDGSKRESGMFT